MSHGVEVRVYLVCAIACEVVATLALRAAVDHYWWYVPVAPGYIASFVILAVVLRHGMPVGTAYGIWAACGVTATAVGSVVLFGDRLTWVMVAGFASIVGGVALVESTSAGAPEEDAPERKGAL
jgi:small multidrug resistance pump